MPLGLITFAPLATLPCVRPMPFFSDVHCLLPVDSALSHNTQGIRQENKDAESLTMNSATALMTSHNTLGIRQENQDAQCLTMNPATALVTSHNTQGIRQENQDAQCVVLRVKHGLAASLAIGSYACSLEALTSVWPITFLSGVPILTCSTVHSGPTLQVEKLSEMLPCCRPVQGRTDKKGKQMWAISPGYDGKPNPNIKPNPET
jgi:hypothetical protein